MAKTLFAMLLVLVTLTGCFYEPGWGYGRRGDGYYGRDRGDGYGRGHERGHERGEGRGGRGG